MGDIAMSNAAKGAQVATMMLKTASHAIANMATPAFKYDELVISDSFYQEEVMVGGDNGDGAMAAGVQIGTGAEIVSTKTVFKQGNLMETGEELDLAIQGPGFLEVELPGGEKGYTRALGLHKDAQGKVVTGEGFPVVGFQNIPTGASLYVSRSGYVTVRGADGDQNYRLQLVSFQNPGGLKKLGGNLYKESGASGPAEIGNPGEGDKGELLQGFLEESNTDLLGAMGTMMLANHLHTANTKALKQAERIKDNEANIL